MIKIELILRFPHNDAARDRALKFMRDPYRAFGLIHALNDVLNSHLDDQCDIDDCMAEQVDD